MGNDILNKKEIASLKPKFGARHKGADTYVFKGILTVQTSELMEGANDTVITTNG